ncbi:MAG: hypothetical protein OXC18_16365 [Desulfurellaceae bacterium]|nr:hypothetical protein [Desulfurellaceae bacterium]
MTKSVGNLPGEVIHNVWRSDIRTDYPYASLTNSTLAAVIYDGKFELNTRSGLCIQRRRWSSGQADFMRSNNTSGQAKNSRSQYYGSQCSYHVLYTL